MRAINKLPSANEIQYFIEICYTLNFSRAAERLGISQPSLSFAMKSLEETIGAKLFVRQKNGIQLTQAGKQLLLQAQQFLTYWEGIKSRARVTQQEVQGSFTLGCHSSIAIYAVSKFLPGLLAKYPKLEIHIKNDISRKITEEVINMSIHIGIVINPLQHPDLIIRNLCDDETTFWVQSGSKRFSNISISEATILCVPKLTQTQMLLAHHKKSGDVPKRIMMIDSLEVVASLTAHGCGVGILPSRVAKELYPKKLRRVEKMGVYPDSLCLIYRNENRNIEAIQTICNAIKESIR